MDQASGLCRVILAPTFSDCSLAGVAFSEGVFWFGVHEGEGDDWFVFPIMLSPAFVAACEQALSFFIPKEGISSYQKQPP